MSKVAIINLPRLDLTRPAIAPGILASLCNSVNLENKIFDFALETYERVERNVWQEFELYWQIDLAYKMPLEHMNVLESLFDDYVKAVLEYDPSVIAISVFSHNSINATNLFLEKIRAKTQARIVIGGSGIQSRIENKEFYADHLLRQGLIDYYCSGEAETTFIPVLEQVNPTGPGINNFGWNQLEKLDDMPIPNYKDYRIDNYHHLEGAGGKSLWISGSRGCVRRCDFCDIGKLWKKFRFRSGDSLSEEIHRQMHDYGVRRFEFTDALINGSMKAFNDMSNTLVHMIDENKIQQPVFGGHFIVRPQNQITLEQYEVSAKAGLNMVSIGLETGSDELRFRMNKKFTNDDTANHLEFCRKNNIKNIFLLFVGHPTETLKDHQQTLEMLNRFRYYVATGTIAGLYVTSAAILEDTPLFHWAAENDVHHNLSGVKGDDRMWFNPNNPELTLSERIRRHLEVYEVALKLQYPINHIGDRLKYMKAILLHGKKENFKYY